MTNAARVPAIAVLLTLVAGCDTLFVDEVPDDVVAPEAVGIVDHREREDDGLQVVLADGHIVVIPDDAEGLEGVVEEGDLLIYGDEPLPGRADRPWYVALRPLASGCIRLSANGEVRGGRMALSYGFSLPLSNDWQEAETRFVDRPAKGFCLDESGAVTRPYS